ncbi:condensation domain-containing protein [Streptomyces sp. MNU76]|uniref:condensation domain-containing protein n=1 Tax=Streptomyces sp. MNU76 TaxID=2560026 RepID=UPI001E53D363|nr:condensation domain-containing protein [Streptomyces sp. MNU76]MCC9711759.1 condensation domain-containing protein [Streptomyces sp. MNU76]
MTRPEFRTVEFEGARSGTYPLTWAQKWMWRAVTTQAPRLERLNVPIVVEIPSGCDLADVLVALAALLERHESLRTRFTVDESGTPRQVVTQAGELSVELREIGDEAVGEAAQRLAEEMSAVPFTVPELSVRAGVVTSVGAPAFVVLVAFHMAVDGWSVRILSEDLAAILRASFRGLPYPPASAIRQPVDRLAYELGTEGKEASTEAARHWERTVARFPARMLPRSTSAPETPRFQERCLYSAALTVASRTLAARHRVTPGTVVLAFVAELLARRSGNTGCGVLMFSHNRFDDSTANLSGIMLQSVPIYLQVEGLSLAERLKQTQRAGLVASASGQYDPEHVHAMLRDLARRTGLRPDLACGVNLTLPEDRENAAGTALDPHGAAEEIRRLLTNTRVTRQRAPDWDDMRFYLSAREEPEGMLVAVRADTFVLSSTEAVHLLRELERLVVEAVLDAEQE